VGLRLAVGYHAGMELLLDPAWLASFALGLVVLVLAAAAVARGRLPRAAIEELAGRVHGLEHGQQQHERTLRDEAARGRRELAESARSSREEAARSMKQFTDSVLRRMAELTATQKGQLDGFSEQLGRLSSSNEQTLERMRTTVDGRLRDLQADNASKLEQMRKTVEEKLHGTLEARLGESFRLVSERLEKVHQGLGEMQSLASGVGDLKRVLTNVKARGTWGEVQLGTLLEQVLAPEQYECNVATRSDSAERVEFCVRLPGRDRDGDDVVWLPIDAKFPQEDYQRLLDAHERADLDGQAAALKQLDARVRAAAREIRSKYVNPPKTTDFAVMFLPTEGLYAEVVRRPELIDGIQREHRIVVAGPTTLAALLNSLQMGFRTLAIERRSSEVWALLAAVKAEFGKFGDIIVHVQKKLQEAANVVDRAATKSRTIERQLRDVQALPQRTAHEHRDATDAAVLSGNGSKRTRAQSDRD